MNEHVYHLLTSIIDVFLWGGEVIGEENLPGHAADAVADAPG